MSQTKPHICCIINIGPHYDFPIYDLMGKTFDCDFYLGDRLEYNIKTFDYHQLTGFQKTLHNSYFSKFYWQKGAMKLLFKKYDYYILTGEPFCLSNWLILLLAKLSSKKTVAWTHGWYGREGKIKGMIKLCFFRLFDKLLVYNEYAINLLTQQGINKQNMFCIANSLDSDHIKSLREQQHNTELYQSHFGNPHPVIIYCGRIQRRKRLDILIESVKKLNDSSTPVNLILVGKDDEHVNLEQLVQKLNLQKQIWFYGPCYDDAVLGQLFYQASLCVSPGNVGLTAIHALSFGCPVITHDDFPYQMPEFEAIRPGITGDFFNRDNVESLTTTIQNWLKNHENDREIIRQHAYDEIDHKWNTHYQIDVLRKVLT